MSELPPNVVQLPPPFEWVALAELNAALEAIIEAGEVGAQARLDPFGIVRLRGRLVVKAGKELVTASKVAKLGIPVSVTSYLLAATKINGTVFGMLKVSAGEPGGLNYLGATLVEGDELLLDGLSVPSY